MEINEVLKERGSKYGPFSEHAAITQSLKDAFKGEMDSVVYRTNWYALEDFQKEALEMIAHKIGRILNGDPNYDDSWRDIAGYAQLVVDILNGKDT